MKNSVGEMKNGFGIFETIRFLPGIAPSRGQTGVSTTG